MTSNFNLIRVFVSLIVTATLLQQCLVTATFNSSCNFYWGSDRGSFTGPDSVDLKLIATNEGSGIASKLAYMYGSIGAKIKLISGNSAGTVTTFYLSSFGEKHYEIDFEFLGNASGQPYTIHTNIFIEGKGGREQQFKPWFNTSDYHTFTISWTPCAVVWLVDDTPIRVFHNYNDKQIGFPDNEPMNLFASLWDADSWATQGGRVKTDWTLAPFVASLKEYKDDACTCDKGESCLSRCSDKNNTANWWTTPARCDLTKKQLDDMKEIQDKYTIYNYCNRAKKNKAISERFKECSLLSYDQDRPLQKRPLQNQPLQNDIITNYSTSLICTMIYLYLSYLILYCCL